MHLDTPTNYHTRLIELSDLCLKRHKCILEMDCDKSWEIAHPICCEIIPQTHLSSHSNSVAKRASYDTSISVVMEIHHVSSIRGDYGHFNVKLIFYFLWQYYQYLYIFPTQTCQPIYTFNALPKSFSSLEMYFWWALEYSYTQQKWCCDHLLLETSTLIDYSSRVPILCCHVIGSSVDFVHQSP